MKPFSMGAKLDGNIYDTIKKDTKKIVSIEIKPKNEHQLVFKYEKRKGKPVTLVGRFNLSMDDKKELLRFLKKRLACGGTLNEDFIELQGNIKDKIKEVLTQDGWKFRK